MAFGLKVRSWPQGQFTHSRYSYSGDLWEPPVKLNMPELRVSASGQSLGEGSAGQGRPLLAGTRERGEAGAADDGGRDQRAE